MIRTKRDRQLRSCQLCHLKKKKCDRQKPCKQCVNSGRTAECVYVATASDISVSSKRGASSSKESPTDNKKQRTGNSPSASTLMKKEGAIKCMMASLGHAEHTNPELLQVVTEIQDKNIAKMSLDIPDLETTMSKLIQNLPAKSIILKLTEVFFEHVNWVCGILDQDSFLQQFYDHMDDLKRVSAKGEASKYCTVASLAFLGLLYRVMALGLNFISTTNSNSAFLEDLSVAPTGLENMYDYLANKVAALTIDQVPTDTLVEERLLYIGYLKSLGHTKRSWMIGGMTLRICQALEHDSEKATGRQKFFWVILRAVDSSMSLILGRRALMADSPMPDMTPPLDTPMIKLGNFVMFSFSKLAQEIANLDYSDPSSVPNMERKIRDIKETSLPAHLQLSTNPNNEQYDRLYPFLPAQRFVIQMNLLNLVASLHKPALDKNYPHCSLQTLRESLVQVLEYADNLFTTHIQYALSVPVLHLFHAAFVLALVNLHQVRRKGYFDQNEMQMIDKIIRHCDSASSRTVIAFNSKIVLEQVKTFIQREVLESPSSSSGVSPAYSEPPQQQKLQQLTPEEPLYSDPSSSSSTSSNNPDQELMNLLGLSEKDYNFPYYILENT